LKMYLKENRGLAATRVIEALSRSEQSTGKKEAGGRKTTGAKSDPIVYRGGPGKWEGNVRAPFLRNEIVQFLRIEPSASSQIEPMGKRRRGPFSYPNNLYKKGTGGKPITKHSFFSHRGGKSSLRGLGKRKRAKVRDLYTPGGGETRGSRCRS